MIISREVVASGISGPRICPDAPTEAAARTTEAATAPWRNLRLDTRGPLTGEEAREGEAGCVVGGVVVFVDAFDFLSSMDNPPFTEYFSLGPFVLY